MGLEDFKPYGQQAMTAAEAFWKAMDKHGAFGVSALRSWVEIELSQTFADLINAVPNPPAPSAAWSIYLNGFTEAMMTNWYDGAQSALISYQIQPNTEKEDFFFAALLGNLLWAATVFFPIGGPATLAAIRTGWLTGSRVATVLGAVAGSGLAGQLASDSADAGQMGAAPGFDLRDQIMKKLNPRKDSLSGTLRFANPRMSPYLALIFGKSISDTPIQYVQIPEVLYWRYLFPEMSFARKTEALYDRFIQVVKSVLDDYNRQYRHWKNMVEHHNGQTYLRQTLDAFIPLVGGLALIQDAKDDLKWQRTHQFKPTLKFDLVP